MTSALQVPKSWELSDVITVGDPCDRGSSAPSLLMAIKSFGDSPKLGVRQSLLKSLLVKLPLPLRCDRWEQGSWGVHLAKLRVQRTSHSKGRIRSLHSSLSASCRRRPPWDRRREREREARGGESNFWSCRKRKPRKGLGGRGRRQSRLMGSTGTREVVVQLQGFYKDRQRSCYPGEERKRQQTVIRLYRRGDQAESRWQDGRHRRDSG